MHDCRKTQLQMTDWLFDESPHNRMAQIGACQPRGIEEASDREGVVLSDLSETGVTAFNKFISYYLFPDARYSVAVTLGARAKVSVGCNPWSGVPRTHEINKICERYGGGGHAVVGAVSVPKAELARAKEIAQEIVAELQT